MIENVQFMPSKGVEEVVDLLIMHQTKDLELQAEISERNKLAFRNRYNMGEILFENEFLILSEFETWKRFAEHYGFSPSVVSNNLRAYRFLFEQKLYDWDSVLKALKEKNINLTVSNFEKLETLFLHGAPPERPKDEKRLENIYAELQDIISRNESAGHNEILEMAVDLAEQVEQAQEHLIKLDAHRRHWHNEKYLEWVRSLGYDVLTGQAVERCEPHHTYLSGEQGGIQDKLPDYLTIPLSADTHRKVESGQYKPTEIEIAKALVNTMGLFIMTHMK